MPLTNPFGTLKRAGAAILEPQSFGVIISVVVASSVHQAARNTASFRLVFRAQQAIPRSLIQVKNVVILYRPRTNERARVARAGRLVTTACG